jgi:hypothetical protein
MSPGLLSRSCDRFSIEIQDYIRLVFKFYQVTAITVLFIVWEAESTYHNNRPDFFTLHQPSLSPNAPHNELSITRLFTAYSAGPARAIANIINLTRISIFSYNWRDIELRGVQIMSYGANTVLPSLGICGTIPASRCLLRDVLRHHPKSEE